MELTALGVDVYSTEVDDKGIDFIARTASGAFDEFEVKSVREYNYIFLPKEAFGLRPNIIAAIVIFHEGQPPALFLIP